MPSGACVIRPEGVRAVTWYLKYTDAAGVQTKERLGREPEWTEKKATGELRHRLADVEREGLRKPRALTFSAFADDWLAALSRRQGSEALAA